MVRKVQESLGVPLEQLLAETAGTPGGDVVISGIALDSRQIENGYAFLAMPGVEFDGRDYIGKAVAAGAEVIIAEKGVTAEQARAAAPALVLEVEQLASRVGDIARRFYGFPAASMHLAGITGTNGKTTTSQLLAQLLRKCFDSCGVIGTLGASLTGEVVDALNTTPDTVSLHKQLAQWREMDVNHVAMEVSSHSLSQGRVDALPFEVAVFTNLSRDHLDYHGDMASYGAAKALLFKHPELRAAIVNLDDAYGEELLAIIDPAVRSLTYSCSSATANIHVRDLVYLPGGVEAWLVSPWGEGQLRSPLLGQFNLGNLMAAVGAACTLGAPLEQVLNASATLQGVAGRMQVVNSQSDVQVVVDYAHTPDALQAALQSLRVHTSGRLWCVFGCGGDRDIGKRPQMGRVACDLADQVIVTSDNPRTEPAMAIIDDVLRGCQRMVDVVEDRAEAIASSVQRAAPGDCVLIAGKGHERYQQIGVRRLPFDDVAQVRLALAARAGS